MTTAKSVPSRRTQTGLPSAVLLAALIILGGVWTARPDTNPPVQLSVAISNAPSGPQLALSWSGPTGAVYLIERRPELGDTGAWNAFDATPPDRAVNQWFAPLDTLGESAGFFRLVAPQPAIFTVEPARFAFGGAVELYVTGQCFGTNTELRVGRLTLTNRVIVNPNLMRTGFTPQVPGTYVFDLVVADNVVSSFTVECYDPGAPASSVLQGPPDEPWASPRSASGGGDNQIRYWKSRTAMPGDAPGLKAREKGNRSQSIRITPSGEVELDEVDLCIPGRGLDFVWGRRYLSRSGPDTEQGNRWDFSYNVRVRQVAGGMEVRDGMGRADVLWQDADGNFARDEQFYVGRIHLSVFRLTFADSGYWEFHRLDGAPAAGRLALIVDRNGNSLRLEYDDLGRLERVVDTLDRTNTIAYSPTHGKIVSVTDSSGRRVTYAYYRAGDQGGQDGDLRSVTSPAVTGTPNGNDFPAGKTTTYTYSRGFVDPRENSLLLAITDAKGQVAHRHVYQHNQSDWDFLRCIGRQAGTTNDRILYTYLPLAPSPANRFAVQKIIVNDRVGNVSEHLYDARHRRLVLREFTGRAVPGLPVSESANRPAGRLRADDPDYFETAFDWNNDSLCTRLVHPRGNMTERLYQRAFNQNSSRSNHAKRHDANLRVLRERACCGGADTDGDGKGDTDERVTRLEHDPRFGAGRPDDGGDTRAVESARIIVDRDTGRSKGFGFVTSTTDPRGNAIAARYDEEGNCTVLNPRAARDNHLQGGVDVLEAVRLAYNAHGQLIGATNAVDSEGCRRVDTFSYYDDPDAPGYGYLRRATRDSGGLVCGSTPHFLIATTYEYDARGNVTRCIDPRGYDTTNVYNALDQLVVRQTPKTDFGSVVRTGQSFFYDANDNLVRVDTENRDHTGALDPDNPAWISGSEFDLLNRETLRWHETAHVTQGPRGSTNRFFYDGNGNLVLEQSPEAVNGSDTNNVVVLQYDERDLLFQVLPAPGTGQGAVDRFDYDGNGNCRKVSKIDAFSTKQKTFVHDGFDRRVRVTDAMGNVETCAYDRNDNLVFQRFDGETTDVEGAAGNRRLRESRYDYDLRNRLTRFRPAFFDIFTGLALGDGEATTTFTYAPNNQLLSETDDNGHTTRYAYDSAGRLARVTDPKTNIVLHAYDACGNPTNTTWIDRSDLGGAEQRFSVSCQFDPGGRLVRRADNVGNNENWQFDSRDNLVRHTDPRGTLAGFAYDGLCRQTLAIGDLNGDGLLDAAADVGTAFAYDDNSRLVSTTDDNGNVTRYGYDSLDRPVATTNADNTVVRLIWSPRSNLALRQDGNGTVVSNSYDLLDRRVRRDIAPGPGVAATTTLETFDYDGEGRVVRAATSPGGIEHTFVWNSLSDLGQQSSGGLSLRATHDGVGNRLSLAYPSGRLVQYRHDALNQPSAVLTGGAAGLSQVAVYAYDGPGRLARIARANGVNTRLNWNGLENSPNPPGDFGWRQVARVNHQVAQGGPFLETRVSAYDPAQNRTRRAQTAPFSTGGDMTTNTFVYDPLNRLETSVTESLLIAVPRTTTYQLDGNGNRQVVTENGRATSYRMDTSLPDPADFQMNQYSLTPFGAHHYDANGNLVSTDLGAGPTVYHYDYADRLVFVERTVGPAMLPVAACAYDALGRRVSKTVFPPAPMAPVTTSWFLDADCDGVDILEERENGALTRSYVLPAPSDSLVGCCLDPCCVAFNDSGDAQFYHADDLGNVLALTDAGGGVIERYDYADFGLPSFLDAKGELLTDATGQPVMSSPAGNPFLFHGMEWDTETRLYHDKGFTGENPLYEGNRLFVGGLSWSSGAAPYDPGQGRHRIRASDSVDRGGNDNWDFGGRSFAGNNPWSGARRPGRTKYSNIVLKRGYMESSEDVYVWKLKTRSSFGGGGGGGGGTAAMFNPREYTITKSVPWKVTVRGWNPEKKEELVGSSSQSGKWKTFRGGGLVLHETAGVTRSSNREMTTGLDVEYRLYGPGAAHWGSAKFTSACTLGGSKELQSWWQEAAKGKNIRKNITVHLRGHRDVGGYRLYGPGQAHWGSARLIVPVAMDKGLR